MEYIRNERLGEGYYKTVLENGLTVLVYPIERKSSVCALLSSRVGSTVLDFTVDGKRVSVPAGTAHFLEHKMFENEDGVGASELFVKIGASDNAYTGFERTSYLFETSMNAEEALEIIIGFVGSPYFTEQTVEKEQGIIAEEIKMYLDNAGWRQMFALLGLLYKIHPVKYDIAGSVESIAEITPEKLYDFYRAFYNPSNMVLAVSGNISAEKVVEICRAELREKDWERHETEIIPPDESSDLAGDYAECAMPVSSPQFSLGFKENFFSPKDRVRGELIMDMLLDIIAGDTSSLFRRLYDGGLINGGLSAELLSGDDYCCVIFSGESEAPEEAASEIKTEIERMRASGIDGGRFDECKRAFIGDMLGEFEDAGAVVSNLTYGHFRGSGVYEPLDLIEDIKKEDLERLLSETMHRDKSALSLILPLERRGE